MEQSFTNILKKIITEQGKEALLNPLKCKAFLSDYTRDEYKKESRLLLQAIEAGAVKAIDAAEDIAACKQQQARILRDDYFLVPEAAADVVDALALVLRGDESEAQAGPQEEDVPVSKALTTPKTAKPGLTRWKEFHIRTIAFDTEIEITGYKGRSATLEIPSQIEGLPVTTIGDGALASSTGILDKIQGYTWAPIRIQRFTSVTIPNSVTHIGNGALLGNKLVSIAIPDSVTHIGVGAFRNNQLSSITIPDSVTHIGEYAFAQNRLTSLIIQNGVAEISMRAFEENQLSSITIPGSVTQIGAGAFWRNRLTSIVIQNGVTEIGNGAFEENQLNSVSIPNSVTHIGSGAFWKNRLTSVIIPNGVTHIDDFAFLENQLNSVFIPDSVAQIGKGAFMKNKLTSVTIPGKTDIEHGAFDEGVTVTKR